MSLAINQVDGHFEIGSNDESITKINFLEIRNFLAKFRCGDRIFIPGDHLDELKKLFETRFCLLLNLSPLNPLSTMETVVLALSFVLSTKDVAYILMSTPSTVETYIKRAKLKLSVKVKMFALFKAVQLGYIKIIVPDKVN